MKTTDTKNIWLDKAAAPDINKWYRKYDIPAMKIRSADVYQDRRSTPSFSYGDIRR